MKKSISILLAVVLILALAACGSGTPAATAAPAAAAPAAESAAQTVYTVGICNFVDDASLNQIIANIRAQLDALGTDEVRFEVLEDNCNLDANVMNQIITNFMAQKVDLMVGVATPVAMGMQAATEESGIPVVFAAVSDPLGAGLVDSLEAPGANITGTSDFLDTTAVMNLIFAADPDADLIGLLYNVGEDSSAAPIAAAKAYLDAKGIAYVERTGTTVDEVMLAAEALVTDGVDAVFTPTDNTIMTAELAIYETFAEAGIPHFTGADSFALNGAFLGYGVDYANLGVETANMIAEILLEGKDPGTVPVKTFDNGTATVNTDICAALGLDYDEIAATFAPFCTQVQPITTAESFDDLA
ncbi:MAG: ABC transporter substrate-binding protein [Oscillospiraceae bacterium]|nr:ABC transporter substrate-binding protein [Oscillospiraceae bacterium]